MKRIFLLILAASTLFAATVSKGIPVTVELASGNRYPAEFLRLSGDTLYLGGFVADSFMTVKIRKDRIQNLFAENGDTLSAERADSLVKNLSQNSSNIVGSDSSAADAAVTDSTADSAVQALAQNDSTATDSTPSKPLPDLKNKALLFPAFRRPIDSALAERLGDLLYQSLRESGESPIKVFAEDFPTCKNSPCIAAIAEKEGAHSVWTAEIQPARHQDSLDLTLHRYLFAEHSQTTERLTVSAKEATRELLTDSRFVRWFEKARGKVFEPEKPKDLKSYIAVETDPDGATLSRLDGESICQTPCTFALADTGKAEFEAYWNVENTLWANRATIRPIPGDTAKIHLRLKRMYPELEIRTVPAGAQIFTEAEISPSSRPVGKTPKTLVVREPGPAEIHLWKEGFKDSVVSFHVNATTKTLLEVRLDSLKTAEEFESQQVFRTIQKRLFWGHLAIGVAIAPAVAGGILLYIAENDRDKARDIREELQKPSGGGKNFDSKVRKNHRYADRSKVERYTGAGLLILSGALLSTGIVLSF